MGQCCGRHSWGRQPSRAYGITQEDEAPGKEQPKHAGRKETKKEVWVPFTHLFVVYSDEEKQRGISPVNDLVVSVLNDGALLLTPTEALSDDFSLEHCPFVDGQELVRILGEPGLPLLIHEQDKFDRHVDGPVAQPSLT